MGKLYRVQRSTDFYSKHLVFLYTQKDARLGVAINNDGYYIYGWTATDNRSNNHSICKNELEIPMIITKMTLKYG
jgi:hypothetical protein